MRPWSVRMFAGCRGLVLPLAVSLLLGPAQANAQAPAGEDLSRLYAATVRSVVWVSWAKGNELTSGTGVVVDARRGLIVTSYHVVAGQKTVDVLFPRQDGNGQVVRERDVYLAALRGNRGTPARVLAAFQNSDLALLQVATPLPAGVTAVRLAQEPPLVGQRVVSIGHPAVAGNLLWILTEGLVRGTGHTPHEMRLLDGSLVQVNARLILAQAPIHPGDSGGPLVNLKGELIGITHGVDTDKARDMAVFIDVTEVRSLITKGDPQVARAAPEVGTGPTVQPAGNPPPSFPLPNADDPNEPQERAALPALRLALALLKEGRNDEAKEFLTKVTATYPNTRAAAHARELLQKLPK